jgi:hypothetical protein
MGKPLQKSAETLYERDFYAWLNDQAAKLRGRSHNELDWDNLAEEIESVGRSERNEIDTRLGRLIQHLLKWQFQPGRRSESWRITIGEQRVWIAKIIKTSPSLKNYPAEIFLEAYADGRRFATNETGIIETTFPLEPPFTVEQALDLGFWPGDPVAWNDVIRD